MEQNRTTSALVVGQKAGHGVPLASWLARSVVALKARALARRSLSQLSEAHLKDIGLTPHDVAAALNAGSPVDISDRLACKAECRAGNW